MNRASTQFAEREGTKIAYRVYGSASRDLIIVPELSRMWSTLTNFQAG